MTASTNDLPRHCSLCRRAQPHFFAEVEGKTYHRCPYCLVTVMDAAGRLDPTAEREIYDYHENDPLDASYRNFIRRLTDPLLERLSAGDQGLDFGCGPGSALAAMLAEQGYEVALYDPFFAPHAEALAQQYDFVTCTEVAEHFFEPRQEFERLHKLLRPGGTLAVMTKLLVNDNAFAHWQYRRDPTHVTFYKAETMAILAELMGWHCEFPVPNVVFFTRAD